MLGTNNQLLQSNLPILGFTVWWGIEGTSVHKAELQALLAGAGLEHLMPADPTPKEALRRAISVWIRQRRQDASALLDDDDDDIFSGGEGVKKKRELIRTIDGKEAKQSVYALIGEDIDLEELGLDYGTKIRIMLEKVPQKERRSGRLPTLLCTTEAVGLVQAQDEAVHLTAVLRPLWEEQQQIFNGRDVSKRVNYMITSIPGTFLVRDVGGVYFVPASERSALEAVKNVIESLPSNGKRKPYCVMLPIVNEQAARNQLSEVVHTGFLQKLKAAQKDVEDLRAKAKDVRDTTVAVRLAKLNKIREQAKVYAGLLGMRQETITEMMSEVERDVQSLLFPQLAMNSQAADDDF